MVANLSFTTNESTNRIQTQIFNVPGFKPGLPITVNTGTVEVVSVNGDNVTLKFSNGATSRTESGGSYSPGDSKDVSTSRSGSSYSYCDGSSGGSSAPSSVSYNSGGYSGTLYRMNYTTQSTVPSPCPVGSVRSQATGFNWSADYTGTVTKPAQDNRYTNYYYKYTVTFVLNADPTITLHTENNKTLYENDIFVIDGQATDSDNGNIVNVKYQINGGTVRAINTGISDGTTAIPFNEQLTFTNGKLFKGTTEITGALTEGTTHQLKVWSEDDKGGKSAEQVRTFYVVPNRAPVITVNPINDKNNLINTDKITISGTTSDPDGNDVVVKYKINSGLATQIHSGPAGAWSFELSVKDLVNGENSIVVEVTDTYNFKTSKTIKLNKAANLTPLSESVQRYKIVSPTGSAQGVLLWIQRSEELEVSAEISMTNGSEQERFVPLIRNDEDTNPNPQPAPVSPGFVEDYFKYRADALAEHIVLKLTLKGNKPITLISGALLQ